MAHLLDRHNVLAHYAIVVFGHSRFLGEALLRNTDILQSFLKEKIWIAVLRTKISSKASPISLAFL